MAIFGRFPHSRTLYGHGREKLDRHFDLRLIANDFPIESVYRNCDFLTLSTLTYAVQACTGKTRAPFWSSTDCQQLSHRKHIQKCRFLDVSHTHVRCIGMYVIKLDRHFGHQPITNTLPIESVYRNCDFWAFPTLRYAA